MLGLDEATLLVCITDSTDISTNNLEIRVEAGVVGGHFKHSQMQKGDGAEGTASHEYQWRP